LQSAHGGINQHAKSWNICGDGMAESELHG
jgi:hypothetical protein